MPTAKSIKSTTMLLRQYRQGVLQARDELVTRYLPVMQRWARGRLPAYGRDLGRSGQWGPAIEIRDRGHRDAVERFGPDHMITVIVAEYLAEVLWLTGDHAGAMPLLEHVAAIHLKRLGADSPKTVAAQAFLAEVRSEHATDPAINP